MPPPRPERGPDRVDLFRAWTVGGFRAKQAGYERAKVATSLMAQARPGPYGFHRMGCGRFGRHSDEILELADGAERKTTEVSGVEWESETREEVGVYFFCSADSMSALVSLRTSASCPRNKWPPRLTLTSRAPGIR